MRKLLVTGIILSSIVTIGGATGAFAGSVHSTTSSTIEYSTPKTEKSSSTSTPAPNSSVVPTPSTAITAPVEAPAAPAPAAPVVAPVEAPAAPIPATPVNYGDPTSCPAGSTLINDIPQMPPHCSIPIPQNFIEEELPAQ